MRGVTIEEISAATRISTRFLEALENEHWDELPGGVFNRGFIRSVARFLGLDEDALVAEYALGTTSNTEVRIPPPRPNELPRNWRSAAAAIVAIALLTASAFFGYRRHEAKVEARSVAQFSNVDSSAPSGAATDVPPAASDQSAPAAAGKLLLKIEASKPASVKVTADGEVVFDGAIQSNDTKQFDANDAFEITSSDSSALVVRLDGQVVPPIGAAGQAGSVTLTRNDLVPAPGVPH